MGKWRLTGANGGREIMCRQYKDRTSDDIFAEDELIAYFEEYADEGGYKCFEEFMEDYEEIENE